MGVFSRLSWAAVLWGLFVLACKPIDQPVSGPVTLTGEWQTITPPEPLRIAGREEQLVRVDIVGAVTDIDHSNGVVVNGQRHVVEGELIDSEETSFPLEVSGQGGNRVFLSRAGTLPNGPDYPNDIIRLRLRSKPGLQVERVAWHSNDKH